MFPHHTGYTLEISEDGGLNDVPVYVMAGTKVIAGMVETIKSTVGVFQSVTAMKVQLIVAIRAKEETIQRALNTQGRFSVLTGTHFLCYNWHG